MDLDRVPAEFPIPGMDFQQPSPNVVAATMLTISYNVATLGDVGVGWVGVEGDYEGILLLKYKNHHYIKLLYASSLMRPVQKFKFSRTNM